MIAGSNIYLEDITLPKGVVYAGAETNPNPVLAAALSLGGASVDVDDEEVADDEPAAE